MNTEATVEPPPILPTPVTWEYLAHTINLPGAFITGNIDPKMLNDALNSFGVQGWELVSTFTTAYAEGGTNTIVLIFKRQKIS